MSFFESLAIRWALLATAALLGACGGDLVSTPATVSVAPQTPDKPQAPAASERFALTPTAGHLLRFSWSGAAGASEYRLLEDPDGASGYAPVATLPASATAHDLAVLLPLRLNARYVLQACNALGCADPPAVAVPDSLARAVDYLKASNTGARDLFGSSLALSADGQTLAVGAQWEASAATGIGGDEADNSLHNSGAVYVFTRSAGGAWRQQAYLKASNAGAWDLFGRSLALSADGGTLAVGAEQESSAATGVDGDQADNSAARSGAVYVFSRSGETWQQQAYLKASHTNAEAYFGSSLAFSATGDTLAVGAPRESSGASGVDGNQADSSLDSSGAVYVFTRAAGRWRQQAYVKASTPGESHVFGTSVALSYDGATLAVGAFGEDRGSGAVYLFSHTLGTWQQQAFLKAFNPGDFDRFGRSLALSGDGRTLAVGAPNEASAATGVDGAQGDNSASNSGAVYVFSRPGERWQQQAYLKASNTDTSDTFGQSIALSADGRTLAVGASLEDSTATTTNGDPFDNTGDANGAAYLFERQDSTWRHKAYLKAPNTDRGDQFAYRVALSGDGHSLAVSAWNEDSAATGVNGLQADNTAPDSGAVYVY